MPGADDPRIGNQQDPTPAQTGGQLSEPVEATGPEHHAGAQGAVEGGKRHASVKTPPARGIFKQALEEMD
jgi:hypothetical protein